MSASTHITDDAFDGIVYNDVFRVECVFCDEVNTRYNGSQAYAFHVAHNSFRFNEDAKLFDRIYIDDDVDYEYCKYPPGLCIPFSMETHGWWGASEFQFITIRLGTCEKIIGANYCMPAENASRIWFEQSRIDFAFHYKQLLVDQSGNVEYTWLEEHHNMDEDDREHRFNVFFNKKYAKWNRQFPFFPYLEDDLDLSYVEYQTIEAFHSEFEDDFLKIYLRSGRERTTINYERMTIIGFLATIGGLLGVFYKILKCFAVRAHKKQYKVRELSRRTSELVELDALSDVEEESSSLQSHGGTICYASDRVHTPSMTVPKLK